MAVLVCYFYWNVYCCFDVKKKIQNILRFISNFANELQSIIEFTTSGYVVMRIHASEFVSKRRVTIWYGLSTYHRSILGCICQTIHSITALQPLLFPAYREYLSEKSKKFVSDAKTAAARHGIEFKEEIVPSNDVVNTISNFAKSNKFDTIVIGARGQSSPKAQFLGSVSNGILNSCLIPVLVVR